MAQFLPFRGLRYDCSKVDLSQVICPPYDVIKGAARDELLARDPHNIVGVELATRYGESASSQQYEASAALLKSWIEAGILLRDDSAFYIYEQEFTVPGSGEVRKRRGVLGALTLEEFGKGVQPHEHTLSGPKADRLNLLRATRTNTSPIFGLVGDDDGWINSLILNVVLSKATAEATDGDGIIHRLWVTKDDETVNGLEAAFENESILIADGHHRYETALNYLSETGNENGGESAVLMMCVSLQDEGLIVLPTHRVVKTASDADLATLPTHLERLFTVEPFDGEIGRLLHEINFNGAKNILGVHLRGQSFILTLKDDSEVQSALDASKSEAFNALDVSVLHRLILENELGIDAEKLAAGGHVAYTIDADEAVRQVEAGEAGAAFLLRSTPAAQVQAVANAGDKMPQKSTYFYPKLATGLVLRPLDQK